MRVKVQKWGNSIALRIPKAFANQISIQSGSSVDLSIHDGKLIIEPISQEEYNFEALISEVKESNLHKEYDNDEPKGREIW